MTSPDHPTGTDRIAEAVRAVPQATHIVNIQGDEPLIDPALIDELAAAMADDPTLDMATAANPLDPADPAVQDPNVVKVVTALDGRALYFSRSPLPFFRNAGGGPAGAAPQGHLRLQPRVSSNASSPGRPRRWKKPSRSNNSAPSKTARPSRSSSPTTPRPASTPRNKPLEIERLLAALH